ncbi:MAG: RrF2 family transcriptional regulator [Gammaproteobacteria bacterium]
MAHITNSVEYGIHCLLWLVYADDQQPSSRDLAELQGVSPSFVAKIFPKLEKAGIVRANEGVRGGYRLAKPPRDITVLDVVDAIEGEKPLFDCQEIRGRCAVFNGDPPSWATHGLCSIHKVMLHAEKSMRDALAQETLASLSQSVNRKAPSNFGSKINVWLSDRRDSRRSKIKRK